MSADNTWARHFVIGLLGRARAQFHGLGPKGEHSSRWRPGDELISDNGAHWRVVKSPSGFPNNLTVNRIWDERGVILNADAGHCYPPSDPLWKAFRRA